MFVAPEISDDVIKTTWPSMTPAHRLHLKVLLRILAGATRRQVSQELGLSIITVDRYHARGACILVHLCEGKILDTRLPNTDVRAFDWWYYQNERSKAQIVFMTKLAKRILKLCS